MVYRAIKIPGYLMLITDIVGENTLNIRFSPMRAIANFDASLIASVAI